MKTFGRFFFILLVLFIAACGGEVEVVSNSIEGEHHYIEGYKAVNADGSINVVVEIPAGSVDKWEVDKSDGKLKWEKEGDDYRKVNYMGYPGNYGMIPRTILPKADGGDGDPLDVLVLGEPVERGVVVECKLIGVVKLIDKGEQDDKLLAVRKGTPFYAVNNIQELEEAYKGTLGIVQTWFSNYKGAGETQVKGIAGVPDAQAILDAAIKAYPV